MQKTKLFFVPLALGALFLWAALPQVSQARDRSERLGYAQHTVHQKGAEQTINDPTKTPGSSLCSVFSSHQFFIWLTPFSWCVTEEPLPPPPPSPTPEPPPPPPPAPQPEPDTFAISGMKWNDENGNGVQDEGEEELESWTITADNASGTISVSTTTSGDGAYAFATLPTDTYTVCETQQEGWTQTFPTDNEGCHEVLLNVNTINVNFGNMQDFEPEPEPEPEPGTDRLLITEVFYDVDDPTHGTEAFNEWIEIYNGTGNAVNLTDWSIEDLISSDVLLENTMLPHDTYAIIARDDTTAAFWTWPAETVVILVGGPIGNGLGNTGDTLYLKDSGGTVVDSVSWGGSVDAFDPSVPEVAEGHSVARSPQTTDTNTAADWTDIETPNPGE